jgi:hypothetical protein
MGVGEETSKLIAAMILHCKHCRYMLPIDRADYFKYHFKKPFMQLYCPYCDDRSPAWEIWIENK